MYKEVTIKGRDLTEAEALKGLFESIDLGCGGVSTSPYFIPIFYDIIKDGITLAAEISTPQASVRSHAVLSAIRRGANAINLVIPSVWIVNKRLELVADDVEAQLNVCKQHGAALRVMVDYRSMDIKVMCEGVAVMKDLGVEYVYPSNGAFLDDYTDNLLWALEFQNKYGVSGITNGKVWKPGQLETIEKSGIFGINFQSPMAVYNTMTRN